MGLLRVGQYNPSLLFVYLIVFGPSILLPTVWGLIVSIKRILKDSVDVWAVGLFLQALSVVVLPFSTFAEPGGLLRYVCGLLMASLLFAARYRHMRVLRYAPLWILMNFVLV